MKPPAFQFYADDFLAGTIDMSDEEIGIYIKLLCVQWSRGGVSDRAAGAISKNQSTTQDVLALKFARHDDGQWRNARLERVREIQADRKQNGSKGGSKTQANAQANAQAKLNPPSPSPSPSPIIDAQTDRGMPTLTEVKAYASMHGVKPEDAEQFWHHFESAGWVDKNGNPIKRWQSKLMTWKTNAAASVGGFDSKKRQPFVSELKAVLEAKRTLRDKIKNRGHENALGWTAANEEDRKQFAALNREIGELIEKIARATV